MPTDHEFTITSGPGGMGWHCVTCVWTGLSLDTEAECRADHDAVVRAIKAGRIKAVPGLTDRPALQADQADPHPDDETTCDTCGDPLFFGGENWCGAWSDAVMCDDCYGLHRPTSGLCEHGNSRSVCPYDHREATR